jgi:hypothetical protein
MACLEASNTSVYVDIEADDGPSAAFVAYSANRKEVWRIGDCSWRDVTTGVSHLGDKLIDKVVGEARSALNLALLEDGTAMDEVAQSDPGRQMMLPLLRHQHVFRNNGNAQLFGFGGVDGREVPDRFLEVWDVSDAKEVVLASDGYPELADTLEETEALLAEELREDPLRIGARFSTKGVRPGQVSFDDLAYIRFRAD